MSKRRFFGTDLDQVHLQPVNRSPAWRVYIWNPNRTTIHDVVLGNPESPRYDVSPYVLSIEFNENVVFENNDDAVASSLQLEVVYDPDTEPVQMTERVWLDGTPVQVFQGDTRIPVNDWVPIFTGVVRGVPTTEEHTRKESNARRLKVTCVDRAEAYLNKVVTARSYSKDTDIGKACVETAIEWMGLDRREIKIGDQDYRIGHKQSQLVDIEVLKGIAQILFVTGKKPRFDSEGFLVSADTDIDKAPVRVYDTQDHAVSIVRDQVLTSVNNSVRLLGLSNELTRVVEQVKRLAHGSITAGYFESDVRDKIYFSETDGKAKGGRRAKNTFLENTKLSRIGELIGEDLAWTPNIEEDGITVFEGEISFDTGFSPQLRAILAGLWISTRIAVVLLRNQADNIAASSTAATVSATEAAVAAITQALDNLEKLADAVLLAQLLLMTEIGRVYWEIHGEPFQNVYQQIQATAQTDGLLTEDIKEITLRNDWLYDITFMVERVKELLRRELIKGWGYTIEMIDDPLVEVDDVIQIEELKFYITSIRKRLSRPGGGQMSLTAWRVA